MPRGLDWDEADTLQAAYTTEGMKRYKIDITELGKVIECYLNFNMNITNHICH